jgi:hypothetical protein
LEPIVHQRIQVGVANKVDTAAIATITAVGPTFGDIFFPAKAQTTVATLAGLYSDTGFIYKFHNRFLWDATRKLIEFSEGKKKPRL